MNIETLQKVLSPVGRSTYRMWFGGLIDNASAAQAMDLPLATFEELHVWIHISSPVIGEWVQYEGLYYPIGWFEGLFGESPLLSEEHAESILRTFMLPEELAPQLFDLFGAAPTGPDEEYVGVPGRRVYRWKNLGMGITTLKYITEGTVPPLYHPGNSSIIRPPIGFEIVWGKKKVGGALVIQPWAPRATHLVGTDGVELLVCRDRMSKWVIGPTDVWFATGFTGSTKTYGVPKPFFEVMKKMACKNQGIFVGPAICFLDTGLGNGSLHNMCHGDVWLGGRPDAHDYVLESILTMYWGTVTGDLGASSTNFAWKMPKNLDGWMENALEVMEGLVSNLGADSTVRGYQTRRIPGVILGVQKDPPTFFRSQIDYAQGTLHLWETDEKGKGRENPTILTLSDPSLCECGNRGEVCECCGEVVCEDCQHTLICCGCGNVVHENNTNTCDCGEIFCENCDTCCFHCSRCEHRFSRDDCRYCESCGENVCPHCLDRYFYCTDCQIVCEKCEEHFRHEDDLYAHSHCEGCEKPKPCDKELCGDCEAANDK